MEDKERLLTATKDAAVQYQITQAVISSVLLEGKHSSQSALSKALSKRTRSSRLEVCLGLILTLALSIGVYYHTSTKSKPTPCIPSFGTGENNNPQIKEGLKCDLLRNPQN